MNCRLSDEHLSAIAWAEPSETTAALARRLGTTYDAVYRARRRLRAAGGWWCALALSTCIGCGRPLLSNAHTVPRQVHTSCERTRRARYRQRYRSEGRPSALSTPYVRAWRQRHPERWPSLPAEVRAAALAKLNAAKARDQALTRAHADRAFRRWSADEDALVLARSEVADRELALELGRTLIAVHDRRYLLRQRATSTPAPGSDR